MPLRWPVFLLAVAGATLVVGRARAEGEETKRACVDANEQGQALRQSSKLLAARRSFLACASNACPRPVSEDCVARIAEIDRATPTVLFQPLDPAGRPIAHVAVRLDDTLLASDAGATEIALDPGTHALTFVPPVGEPRTVTVSVREGEKRDREVVVVQGRGGVLDAPWGTQRVAGVVVAGLGAAGLVAGTVLGVLSKVTYDSALSSDCRGSPLTCTSAGGSQVATAHGEAAGATGAFIGGAAAVAAGVVLFATGGTEASVTPTTGGAALRVGGSF